KRAAAMPTITVPRTINASPAMLPNFWPGNDRVRPNRLKSGSVATLQEWSDMLRQCSLRHRFPVCSSGGNSNRKSSFWRLVGICVFPCRTGTSRSCSPRRAGDSRGSRRFLDLSLRAEIRIPAPEGVLPLFVEHTGSYLQEKMCSTLSPPHLLSLHHP